MDSALSAGLPWIRGLPAESAALVVSASLADFLTRVFPEAMPQQCVETTAIMRLGAISVYAVAHTVTPRGR
jgi:hypothetical protein